MDSLEEGPRFDRHGEHEPVVDGPADGTAPDLRLIGEGAITAHDMPPDPEALLPDLDPETSETASSPRAVLALAQEMSASIDRDDLANNLAGMMATEGYVSVQKGPDASYLVPHPEWVRNGQAEQAAALRGREFPRVVDLITYLKDKPGDLNSKEKMLAFFAMQDLVLGTEHIVSGRRSDLTRVAQLEGTPMLTAVVNALLRLQNRNLAGDTTEAQATVVAFLQDKLKEMGLKIVEAEE